jgi:ribonuclease HII
MKQEIISGISYTAPIAGIDEAGRGPWAGPVVAAAVIFISADIPDGLDDSKKITAKKRNALFPLIMRHDVGVGVASVAEIDTLNIRRANHLAMQRAVAHLGTKPKTVLIDGNDPHAFADYKGDVHAIIGGDGLIAAISAASIIAKVTRDRLMAALDAEYPGYSWLKNQGYGTAAHAAALKELGVTKHHRHSFAPIRALLKTQS